MEEGDKVKKKGREKNRVEVGVKVRVGRQNVEEGLMTFLSSSFLI